MFFSIIIPVYNVERFITRGLRCISDQSFTDYEIILVDDGSTDHSPELCDDAADADNRIRVIHARNEGAGPARNKGIEAAVGEYLLFFDIDDILYENALEVIYDRLHQYCLPQLLLFSYREYDVTYKTTRDYIFDKNEFRSNKELRDNYVGELSGVRFNNGFVWNKVYKRSFIINNNLRFEALKIQQDEVFNIEIYKKAETVVLLPDVIYEYYVYASGNTRSRFIPERLAIYRRVRGAFLSLVEQWQLNDERFNKYIHRRFVHSVITYLNYNLYHSDNRIPSKDKRSELRRVLTSNDVATSVSYLNSGDISGRRMLSILYYCSLKEKSPGLYSATRRIDAIIRGLMWRLKAIVKR